MTDSEIQIKEMLLQATLLANLSYFKEKLPAIYEQFKDFKATDTGIAFDKNGNINLLNNGCFVYEESPLLLAKKQVSKYLNNPVYSRYEIQHSPDEEMYFKQQALLKSMYNVRNEQTTGKIIRPTQEKRLDFVCFLGAGLGYQIEELFNQKELLNVLLFEPNPSAFYALLHCIELRPLAERCVSLGGVFRICVGGDESSVVYEVNSLLHKQGMFNVSLIHYFKHYDSPLMEKTINKIKSLGYRWSSGWGFFEDEVIGLEHTLSNLKSKFPVIKHSASIRNPLKKAPVFLVANGPSLDLAINFIKLHIEDLVIVSCGTALKALLSNNIKPDIHVEMERSPRLEYSVLAVERDKEIDVGFEQLNIVALNTVYTPILARFKSTFLLTKINDAGGTFIKLSDKNAQLSYPRFTNPTVTNAGLVVATELGFENIYLVGTDFGFISEDTHHAKDSIYYDKDYKYRERADRLMQGQTKVKGNFRDEVLTTFTFDSSRGSVEELLKSKPNVRAYNTCDGAYIENAEPKKISNIKVNNKILNKPEKILSLLKNSSSLENLSMEAVERNTLSVVSSTKSYLEELLQITNMNFDSRESLAGAFYLQNELLHKISKDNEAVFWLIQGSFKYFQSYIMACSYYYSNLENRMEFINACVDAFHGHIEDVYIDLTKVCNI
ncbi:6-hydroxymethylpterin diphosphokinase MptE-like protein [Pseudoalteromonas sp. S4741]|uniref:motility associated factor glycosyltransferase family protein n=1 Tax=Pseudoalteromonas sp. S4741 TaxID=579563 RepID=UPI00110A13B9|nr:6-hydroxymethylpterin diphosphokinase MptE-like protein [Pseudoalteromonas sp. S4741]TMO23983.1 hypothetical protein CWC30_08015 [Pseudoalteromonas sp. S4741]